MLEPEILGAEADVQAADARMESALEASGKRQNLGDKVIAAAIAQAGARIAVAMLRSAQALAQSMGDRS